MAPEARPCPAGAWGETGALVRAHDWAATPLGAMETWPRSLRTAVDLMLAARQPAYIAWGAELTSLYNDGSVPILGAKHPGAMGKPFAEVFAEIWGEFRPLVEATMAGEAQHFVDRPVALAGRPGEPVGWFTFSWTPLRDDAGTVAGFFCMVTETTGAVRAEEAVRENREEALRESEARFGALLRATSDVLYCMSPDWAEMRQLSGGGFLADAPAPTRNWLKDYIHPADQPRVVAAIAEAIRTGGVFELEHRVLRPDGSLGWTFSRAVPILDERGGIKEWFGAASDVTARREAEERQALLSREVDHRAKNALAVVQAALRLTPKTDVAGYAAAVEGRVGALARAQTLLAEGRWAGAGLRALVQAELAPFLGEHRADLRGPPVVLPPRTAQPLAMAVHELATNALKHGALSVPDGRLSVSWTVEGAAPRLLRFRWEEAGGPPVAGPPKRRGFGSRVLQGTLRGQLGGAVSLSWDEAGLVCEAEVPLRPGLAPAVPARELEAAAAE